MKKWLYEKLVIQFLEIHDTPARIARGVGLGMFVALTPTMGFQMIIAAVVNTFLHANRIAGILMVWITNPITMFFIYPINYFLGAWVLNIFADWGYVRWTDITGLFAIDPTIGTVATFLEFFSRCFELGAPVFIAMLLGGFIIGAVLGIILYRITYRGIVRSRKRKSKLYYSALEGAIATPENGCVCASMDRVATDFLKKHYTWDDMKYTIFLFRERCVQCGRGYKRYLINLLAYLSTQVAHLAPELKTRMLKDKSPEERELASICLDYIAEFKERKKAGIWTEKPEEAEPSEKAVPDLPEEIRKQGSKGTRE
ncbi:MAG: DUF2062 domain-containing protein [Planctomycetota bacterium]|nr:MAG: DUF2062 domain-containing protein [Planctomycetota bacterium]